MQKKRRAPLWLLGCIVLILLGLLVLLQSSNLWKNLSVETASDTLALYALSSLNFIAFIIFGFIFLRSIIKLARERRSLELGSKIKTRLWLYFFAISLLPIIAMAVFSYLFMNRALERWFTQIPENVIRDAREIQSDALAERFVRLQQSAQMLAAAIDKRETSEIDLHSIAAAGRLTYIEIQSADGQTIFKKEVPLDNDLKNKLEKINQIARTNSDDTTLQDGKGFDVAFASLSDGRRLLVIPEYLSERNAGQFVDSSLAEFDQLKDKQVTIRQIGLLTLGVLTFLLIFASTWIAFYIARGLTVPIKALAIGAGEIAKGNLEHRVNVFAEDELALLVAAFNQMSARLEENSAALSEGRRYIETILGTLPTGVISVNADDRVTTINKSAEKILRLQANEQSELNLEMLTAEEDKALVRRVLLRAKRIGQASEQSVLKSDGSDGNVPVALTARALPNNGGVVLVIEDLSELIQAQRAAAWQEVARRMAHEIKNPLTPIQLSAERIAKRFAESNGNQASEIVKEGTETILREVDSLKLMVDEFSQFARLPNVKLQPGNVNDLARQAVQLYEGREFNIEQELSDDLPQSMIDAEQLKRVFVNILENAIEAFDEAQETKLIKIVTRHDSARDLLIIEISDNGRGISPSDLQKLFQPYFSTKGRGTGLGLAIVNRIITEHRGKIYAANTQTRGAKFIIELLVVN